MLREVLIGSKAIEYHLGDILKRQSKDEDYLTLKPIYGKDCIDGIGILDKYYFKDRIASIDEIYTLKVSHSPWVIKSLDEWYKHIYDIRTLKENRAKLVPELHDVAYNEWVTRKGAKLVNLNKEKKDFFNKNVVRYYDHDSVHNSISFGLEPAFKKILLAGSDVKVSKELFDKLDERLKRNLVFEETMVLSLERDLIPRWKSGKENDKFIIYKSYSEQLRLLITQYSKGWFPQWIIENYFDVSTPPLNYWELFQDSNKKILL